jgi:hypothetical protein
MPIWLTAAGLLQAAGPAICTVHAAFQQHQQQEQQQQEQQNVLVTSLARICIVCLACWGKAVSTCAAAAAAAAASAASSRGLSGTGHRSVDNVRSYSWLLPDPASAALLPAVAQLTLGILQAPNTPCAAGSSVDGGSSSSSSDARLQESGQDVLQLWPLGRDVELHLALRTAIVITASVVDLDDAYMHSVQVQALLAQPQLQQHMLLHLALAVQALYVKQQGLAPMPAVAAAVAAALPCNHDPQHQQEGHECQLCRLGHGEVQPWMSSCCCSWG